MANMMSRQGKEIRRVRESMAPMGRGGISTRKSGATVKGAIKLEISQVIRGLTVKPWWWVTETV